MAVNRTDKLYQGFMMKRFCSLHAVIGAFLLCGNIPAAMADWDKLAISNCSVTAPPNGDSRWKVSFDVQRVFAASGPGTPTTASMRILVSVPKVNKANGMMSYTFLAPVPASDFSFPLGYGFLGGNTPSSTELGIGNDRGQAIINTYALGTITFYITPTEANQAYPAAFIQPQTTTSGAESSMGFYWLIPNVQKTCIAKRTLGPGQEPPPITELIPVDPEFTMKAAEWVLQTADVGDLPDVTAAGTGYPATINNVSNNNLCVNYVTAGVKTNQYALAVTNSSSSQGGRNLFTLPGANGSKLYYNLQLASNDGNSANNFNFPATGTPNYITLGQANNYSSDHSEMCWTPKINLFKDASTTDGSHADSLNFIIMPKA